MDKKVCFLCYREKSEKNVSYCISKLYFNFIYAHASICKLITATTTTTKPSLPRKRRDTERGRDREMAQFSDVMRFLSLLAFLHIIASSYKHIYLVVAGCVCVCVCDLGSSKFQTGLQRYTCCCCARYTHESFQDDTKKIIWQFVVVVVVVVVV